MSRSIGPSWRFTMASAASRSDASRTAYCSNWRMSRIRSRTSGSSSTTSTVLAPDGAALDGCSAPPVAFCARGRRIVNVEPRPTLLDTSMRPPAWATTSRTVESPSPVPFPGSFVVKYGSKRRAWVTPSMPTPVSLTTSTMSDPAFSVSMVSRPPWGIASRAFTTRFMMTWPS